MLQHCRPVVVSVVEQVLPGLIFSIDPQLDKGTGACRDLAVSCAEMTETVYMVIKAMCPFSFALSNQHSLATSTL
jgi:hypothetical protein